MLPRKKRSRQKLLQQHTSRMLKASDTTPTNISSLSCPHTSSQFNLTDRRPVKLTSFKMKTSQKPDTLSCLVTQVVYRPSQFCLHGKVSKCSITLSWSTKTPLWKKVGAVVWWSFDRKQLIIYLYLSKIKRQTSSVNYHERTIRPTIHTIPTGSHMAIVWMVGQLCPFSYCCLPPNSWELQEFSKKTNL